MTNKRSRRATLAFLGALAGQEHRRRTQWFKPPAAPRLTAGRVAEIHGVPAPMVGAVELIKHTFPRTVVSQAMLDDSEPNAEWAARELHRPSSTLNHRTARFAGKPYHWRQDYTGQLKLAAGESPW